MTEPAFELDQEVDQYLLHLQVERGLAKNTLEAYGRDLASFTTFVIERGATAAEHVTGGLIEDWVATLARYGKKASSQARMLVAVRGFYRFVRKERGLEQLPTEQVELPKQRRPLPIEAGEDTISAMLAAVRCPRDRALLALLYGAGLRVSEVTELRLSCLHLDAGVVQVTGKGSKQRLVPLGPVVAEHVRSYLEQDRPRRVRTAPSDAVFPGRSRAGLLSRQTVFLRVRRAALEAGLQTQISPHKLRHGFASDLVRGGADLRSVQAMLGHADLRTTEIYTHVDERHKRKVYDQSHPRS